MWEAFIGHDTSAASRGSHCRLRHTEDCKPAAGGSHATAAAASLSLPPRYENPQAIRDRTQFFCNLPFFPVLKACAHTQLHAKNKNFLPTKCTIQIASRAKGERLHTPILIVKLNALN